jgi:hypothetical protein
MPEAVRSLKMGVGVPSEFEDDPQAVEKWHAILETIAKGFEAAKRLNNIDFKSPEESVEIQKTMNKGLGLFCKYYHNLWD